MSKINHIAYKPKPDYTRPLLEISSDVKERMFSRLKFLYGEEQAQAIMPELERVMKVHYAHKPQELSDREKDFNPEERFSEKDLDEALENPGSKLSLIRQQFRPFAYARVREKAFHPNGEQQVLKVSPSVLSVLRMSPDGKESILTLTNVTGNTCDLVIKNNWLGSKKSNWHDLINETVHIPETQGIALTLQPYDVVWLKERR